MPLDGGFDGIGVSVECGATLTTEAPFRETDEAIASVQKTGLLAVEMEAAALDMHSRARIF